MHQERSRGIEIKDLPNEVLLAIFTYLSVHDVRYSVSKVCLRWSDLARDVKLWKSLEFKTTNRSSRVFGAGSWFATLKFLETTPELQNLVLSRGHSEDETVDILNCLESHCPNLRHIEFDDSEALVVGHLKGLKNLFARIESLKVNLCSREPKPALFKILTAFKNLNRMVYSGLNPETTEFRLFLRRSARLANLDLSGVPNLSKANFTSLWKFRDKFVSLGLKIDELDEDSLKLLPLFPNLENLSLADGNSSPGKLVHLGRLACLRSLHIQEDASSPVLTATTLADFFRGAVFSRLTHLKLHKSRLDDEGAAEIRRNCPSLTYLEVMTYPRCRSGLTQKALLHFLHCERLQNFEILFDQSEETDWIYRRVRNVHHDCDVDGTCSVGLDVLLTSWDEIQIPVD